MPATAKQVYSNFWAELTRTIPPADSDKWTHTFTLSRHLFTLTMNGGKNGAVNMLLNAQQNEIRRPSDDGRRLDATVYAPEPGAKYIRIDTQLGPWYSRVEDTLVLGEIGLKQLLVDSGRGPRDIDPNLVQLSLSGLAERLKAMATGLEAPPPVVAP